MSLYYGFHKYFRRLGIRLRVSSIDVAKKKREGSRAGVGEIAS